MHLKPMEYGNKNAPLLLFLHGGGVSSWMWDKQIEMLSTYRCVTIDCPGHGELQHLSSFSIQTTAAAINDWISTHSNEQTVTVIGFSLGAQVLIQMMSDRPHLIDYALINSASVEPQTWLKRSIKPLISLTFPLLKNKTFAKQQASSLGLGEAYFDRYFEETRQIKRQILIDVLEENLSFQLPPSFSQATTKCLVTVGEKELGKMKTSAARLVAANNHCTGVIVEGVGHGISFTHPEVLHQLITCWIEKQELPNQPGFQII